MSSPFSPIACEVNGPSVCFEVATPARAVTACEMLNRAWPLLCVPVFTRSSYGNEHVYVADKDLASHLSALTRSKTLLPEHVTALKELGFTFRLVGDPESKRAASVSALLNA